MGFQDSIRALTIPSLLGAAALASVSRPDCLEPSSVLLAVGYYPTT